MDVVLKVVLCSRCCQWAQRTMLAGLQHCFSGSLDGCGGGINLFVVHGAKMSCRGPCCSHSVHPVQYSSAGISNGSKFALWFLNTNYVKIMYGGSIKTVFSHWVLLHGGPALSPVSCWHDKGLNNGADYQTKLQFTTSTAIWLTS